MPICKHTGMSGVMKCICLCYGIFRVDWRQCLLLIDQAGWLSRHTFHWVSSLVYVGYIRQLNENDLPPLDLEFTAESELSTFKAIWAQELLQPRPSLGRALWKKYRKCAVKTCEMNHIMWFSATEETNLAQLSQFAFLSLGGDMLLWSWMLGL